MDCDTVLMFCDEWIYYVMQSNRRLFMSLLSVESVDDNPIYRLVSLYESTIYRASRVPAHY